MHHFCTVPVVPSPLRPLQSLCDVIVNISDFKVTDVRRQIDQWGPI